MIGATMSTLSPKASKAELQGTIDQLLKLATSGNNGMGVPLGRYEWQANIADNHMWVRAKRVR